jgi:mRNA-degrading endonuclease RelE of RelBE toxin-antitoxin system
VPPLGIEITSRFRSAARNLPVERQEQVAQALDQLSRKFGQPHLHDGLGVRRLKGHYFEFRIGRDTRVIFTLVGSTATLRMIGSHDDVRKYLRNI